MSSEDESVTVTLKVAAELERLGVDYFVGGSVASSVHGRPRTTDDVDVVAAIAGPQVDAFVRAPLRDSSVWSSSPEDIVIEKLDWYRKGEGISERQWRDVLGVLAVQGARLDLAYLRQWASRRDLSDLLERALAEVKTA